MRKTKEDSFKESILIPKTVFDDLIKKTSEESLYRNIVSHAKHTGVPNKQVKKERDKDNGEEEEEEEEEAEEEDANEWESNKTKLEKIRKTVRFIPGLKEGATHKIQNFLFEATKNRWFDWNSQFEVIIDGKLHHGTNLLEILRKLNGNEGGGVYYASGTEEARDVPYGAWSFLRHMLELGFTIEDLHNNFGFATRTMRKLQESGEQTEKVRRERRSIEYEEEKKN